MREELCCKDLTQYKTWESLRIEYYSWNDDDDDDELDVRYEWKLGSEDYDYKEHR